MTLETKPVEHPAKSVQELRGEAPIVSTGRVLLGILKSIENELRKREHLWSSGAPLTPLWFIAETERNVFLWRTNQSLDDAQKYSFWVDIRGLISKRREQLSRPQDSNPFTNPLWGSGALDPSLVERERDYLDALEDLMPSAFRTAEALSRASESLRLEIDPEAVRTAIIIPSSGSGPLPATPQKHSSPL
jgi:hypothetical protein